MYAMPSPAFSMQKRSASETSSKRIPSSMARLATPRASSSFPSYSRRWGIQYTHNYPIWAQGRPYMIDFYFPDSQDFHEHMGMLDDEQYAQSQKRKLEDYAAIGIQKKKTFSSRRSIT